MQGTQRIISKHSLIVMGRGNTEIAAQVFVYDQIREIRADLEKLEVRVLMSNEDHFHRVFKAEVNDKLTKEQAAKLVIDFYNNLLNASMKLTEEERSNLVNQRKIQVEKIQEAIRQKQAGQGDNQEVESTPSTEEQ